MSKPLIPPRGIFATSGLLFDSSLPASVKETVLQLMALTWNSPQHCTPVLTVSQLANLTGKTPRTLRGHLQALLAEQIILERQVVDGGRFILTLADWLFKNTQYKPGGVAALEGEANRPPLASRTHAAGERPASKRPAASKPRAVTGKGAGAPAGRVLSKKLEQDLLAFGVFPTLIDEVASSSYSEADLRALLAWCRIDAPDTAAGLFIGRLRAGACAPRAYHGEPCDVCGQYGRHAPNCRRSYAQDIYVTS